MKASELGCVGTAALVAQMIEERCVSVDFTSGRRSIQSQAAAMASNCVLEQHWIVKTYAPGAVATALQSWVDAHYYRASAKDLAIAFVGIMTGFSDTELAHLSGHLGGTAFDVAPATIGQDDRAWLQQLVTDMGGKVLFREGGLERVHVQFPAVAAAPAV